MEQAWTRFNLSSGGSHLLKRMPKQQLEAAWTINIWGTCSKDNSLNPFKKLSFNRPILYTNLPNSPCLRSLKTAPEMRYVQKTIGKYRTIKATTVFGKPYVQKVSIFDDHHWCSLNSWFRLNSKQELWLNKLYKMKGFGEEHFWIIN